MNNVQIVLLTPSNWDGGWEGRFGTIIDTALARDQPTVKKNIDRFEPLTPVRAEQFRGGNLG